MAYANKSASAHMCAGSEGGRQPQALNRACFQVRSCLYIYMCLCICVTRCQVQFAIVSLLISRLVALLKKILREIKIEPLLFTKSAVQLAEP